MPEKNARQSLCTTAHFLIGEDTHPEYVRGMVELIAYWTHEDPLNEDIDGTIKDVLTRIERRPWKWQAWNMIP